MAGTHLLKLVKIFEDKEDALGRQGLFLVDLVHDPVNVFDYELECDLDDLVPNLRQIKPLP